MKKLHLLAVCFLICTLQSFAQDTEKSLSEKKQTFTHEQGALYITPRVGCSMSSLMGTNTSGVRFSFAGGIELEGFLTDAVSLSLEALYARQGGEKDLNGIKTKIRVDYLKIPLMANFYIYKGLAIKMGFQFAINMSNHFDQSDINRSGHLSDIGYKSRDFDLSIPVGIAYEFKNHIVIDARYNISTSKFFIDSDATRFNTFMLTVGYRFKHE